MTNRIVAKLHNQLRQLATTLPELTDVAHPGGQLWVRILEEMDLLTQYSQHQKLVLETSSAIIDAAGSILSIDELLRVSANLIRNSFDFYFVGIYLIDEISQRMTEEIPAESQDISTDGWAELRAGTGEAGRFLVERKHRVKINEESALGWAIKQRKFHRVRSDEGEKTSQGLEPNLPGARSQIVLPLVARRQAIGAIVMQSMEEDGFSEAEALLLQTVADQLTNSIQGTQLLGLADQQMEQLVALHNISLQIGTHRTLETLLEDLALLSVTLLGAEASIIRLKNGLEEPITVTNTVHLPQHVPVYRVGEFGAEIYRQMVETRQAVIANHRQRVGGQREEDPLAILEVPFVFNSRVIGGIEVQSYSRVQAFDDNDLYFLSLLAAQAVAAIENIRLFKETQNSQRFLKSIIEHIPDPIFIKNRNHTLIEMNQANAAVIGRPAEVLLGKTDRDFFEPELAEKFFARDDEVFTGNRQVLTAEDTTIWADGQEHTAYTRLIPITGSSGQPEHLLGITHDVTERKAHEAERERLLSETASLYHGSQAIARGLSERQIFEALFEQIKNQDPCEICAYGLKPVQGEPTWAELRVRWRKSEAQPELEFYAEPAPYTSTRPRLRPRMVKHFLPETSHARLLTTGAPFFIDDISTDERLSADERAGLMAGGACAAAVLPITITGQALGVVLVFFTRPYSFNETTQRFWLAMVEQAGVALANRQMIHEAAYRAVQMETAAEVARASSSLLEMDELLHAAVELICDRFELYYVGIFLLDKAREWAVLRAGSGEAGRIQLAKEHRLKVGGESMIGWSIANRQPRIALDVGREAVRFQNPDLPETRSEMALPLIYGSEVIGALTVQSAEQAAFSREDIIFLQTMADQLANAIQNARLFRNARESQTFMKTIIDQIPDPIFIKDREHRWVVVNRAFSVLMGLPEEKLIGYSDYDYVPKEEADWFWSQDNKLFETGQAQETEETITDASKAQRIIYTRKLPLLSAGDGKPEYLVAIINDITQRKRAERLQASVYRISEAANTTTGLEDLFKTIHEIVGELMPAENFYIALYDPASDTVSYPYFVDQQDAPPPPRRPGRGLTDYVLRTGQPLLANPETMQQLVEQDKFIPTGSQSVDWLGVPLKTQMQKQASRGVMVVQTYNDRLRLGQEERYILEFISVQVAMAIERKRTEEALAAERNLLRTLVDNVPDFIYVKDRESRFVFNNQAHARILGARAPEDIQGKTDFDCFPLELARQYYNDEQELMKTGQPLFNREEPLIDREGNVSWVSSTKVPLRDAAGQVIGFVGATRDITERKKAEEANRQLLSEVQHRSTLLQIAADVSRAASSILDIDALINTSVNLIRDKFDFYYVGLFLLNETRHWAVLRAGTGEAGQIQLANGHKLEVGGESMIGWCVAHRQARIALDVGQEAVRFNNPHLPGTHSEMALPLISRDEVIGALTVQSTERGAFSRDDITVLQTMADQVANAIGNARLFQEVARAQLTAESLLQETQALHQLSQALAGTLQVQEIMDIFFQACTREIGFEYVVFCLADKYERRIRAVGGAGVTQSHLQRTHRSLDSSDILADIIRNGQTEVVTGWDERFDLETFEAEGHAAWTRLFTPVTLRQEHIGVVEAGFNQNPEAVIRDSHIRLLRAFIDQTALALDNAQRYEASQRAARREALIKEITTRVRASTDLDTVLQITVREIGEAIGSKRAYIHLAEKKNGEGLGKSTKKETSG